VRCGAKMLDKSTRGCAQASSLFAKGVDVVVVCVYGGRRRKALMGPAKGIFELCQANHACCANLGLLFSIVFLTPVTPQHPHYSPHSAIVRQERTNCTITLNASHSNESNRFT